MSRTGSAVIRGLARVLLPDGVLLIGLLLLPTLSAFDPFRPYIDRILIVGLAVLIVLGLRLRQKRLVLAGVLVFAGTELMELPPLAALIGAPLVPMNLMLLSIVPQHGPAGWMSVVADRAILIQIVGILALAFYTPGGPAWGVALSGGDILITLMYAVALVVLAAAALHQTSPVRRGLFWTGLAAMALQFGPPEPLAWPAQWPAVAGLAILLIATIEEAYHLAYYDRLTGLASRRALDDYLGRKRGRFVVAMVDVDHFKRINDEHGHAVGDQVLRLVASRLRETPGARAYRYGGEEFALVFRNQSVDEVRSILEAMRARVAGYPFALRSANRPSKKPKRPVLMTEEPETISVTVSVGAARRERRESAQAVLDRADEALYSAKEAGRNRVVA